MHRFVSTRRLLAGLILGLVAFTGIRVAAQLQADPVPSASAPAAIVEPLPAEWRWERETVSFDHMYGTDTSR